MRARPPRNTVDGSLRGGLVTDQHWTAYGACSGAPPDDLFVEGAAQQRPALTLGSATPDAEQDPVVEGVDQAVHAHSTVRANLPGRPLRRTFDEQIVGGCARAGAVRGPVLISHQTSSQRPINGIARWSRSHGPFESTCAARATLHARAARPCPWAILPAAHTDRPEARPAGNPPLRRLHSISTRSAGSAGDQDRHPHVPWSPWCPLPAQPRAAGSALSSSSGSCSRSCSRPAWAVC